MKKKILFILISSLILLTGCSANYKLTYEKGTFKEYLNVTGNLESSAFPTYEQIKNNGLSADVDGKEQFILEDGSSRYDVTLTHELKDVELERLRSVSQCFEHSIFKEIEGSYYLSVYGDFTCTHLTDSNFILETTEEVIIENAHEKKDNQYIWHLNEEELTDGITFQIAKYQEKKVTPGTDTMLSTTVKLIITLLIIVASVVLFLILKKQKKKDFK